MKRFSFLMVLLGMLGFCSACFEVREDVQMNADGSGRATLTVNLLESQEQLVELMGLEEAYGMRIPKRAEIDAEVARVKAALVATKGLSKVGVNCDYNRFVFSFSADFADARALNRAINTVMAALNRGRYAVVKERNFAWDGGRFSRLFGYEVPEGAFEKLSAMQQFVAQSARYTCIYRFDRRVKGYSNGCAELSGSKTAVMLQYTLADLLKGDASLANEIWF